MEQLETIFWCLMAAIVMIGVPLFLLKVMYDYFRGKGSQRQGSGSLTAGVGAAMQELDRLMTRPSVEHKVDAENRIQQREDDSGGD